MGADAKAPVIIIKRKKVIAGGGHHGGAWKVAYADFVTAMMAFFMLMWLLNATTESQRKGIADYFSPTIPMARVSGGGDGAFGGDSVFTEDTLARNGTGAATSFAAAVDAAGGHSADDNNLSEIESILSGGGGESLVMDNAMKHIVTRLTDEGLIIEIFDLEGVPLFEEGSATPTPIMQDIAVMLADIFAIVTNDLAVSAHTRAHPIVLAKNPVWNLSQSRANQLRLMLGDAGFDGGRVQRVTGYADRKAVAKNPMSVRNNRIELILLRSNF